MLQYAAKYSWFFWAPYLVVFYRWKWPCMQIFMLWSQFEAATLFLALTKPAIGRWSVPFVMTSLLLERFSYTLVHARPFTEPKNHRMIEYWRILFVQLYHFRGSEKVTMASFTAFLNPCLIKFFYMFLLSAAIFLFDKKNLSSLSSFCAFSTAVVGIL